MTDLRKKDDILVKDWKKQMTELNKKHREDIKSLLTKEQKGQIEKMKLDKKKIADINTEARMKKMKLRLDMNDDQLKKIKKLRGERIEKMRSLREDRSMDMPEKREEMKMLIEKRKENIRSIMNEDQMKKLQEIRKPIQRKRRVLS